MKEKYKSVIVVISALSIAILLLLAFTAFAFGSDLCGHHIIEEKLSPNHSHKIVLYDTSCGATTDFTTHISILKSDEAIEKNAGTIFTAYSENIIGQFDGLVDVEIEWLTDQKILIKFDKKVRDFEIEKSYEDFNIQYQRI